MNLKKCVGVLLSIFIIFFVLYLQNPSLAQAQTSFSAFNDFSSTSNPTPDGAWRYGYTQTLGGTFNSYTSNEMVLGGISVWKRQSAPTEPSVAKNLTNATITSNQVLLPHFDYLHLHPGQNGEFSVIRWTAPSSDTYNINARFDSLRHAINPIVQTTTDVHVLYNSTPIFNDFINGFFTQQVKNFTTTLNLNAGDTIDFVVGFGSNQNYSSDSTGVKAIISSDILTPTPTPTPDFTIEEFDLPVINSIPAGIVEGSDKNIWFVEFVGNKIARMTPQGYITEFSIPTPNSRPVSIIGGPDGNLWFTEWAANKIARITTNGSFLEYTIPTPGGYIENLTIGQDGKIWFSEGSGQANKIGRVTLEGVFTEYSIPTQNASPHGMTLGPDGNVWFTEYGTSKIGKITPQGVITEYTIPTLSLGPFAIITGPDGALWFTTFWSPNIGRITTDGTFSEFFTPSGTSTLFITVGEDGALWFTEPYGNKIGRITTAGSITEYAVPTIGSFPHSITTASNGNIWFTEWYGNKVGRITFNQAPSVDASGPYQVNEDDSVQLTATGTDPENGPLAYAWDLDNNGSFETLGQTVTFSAEDLDGPTSKTVVVQVTDNGNLTATDQATVNVINVSPTVGTITAPTDPVLVNTQINTSVSFSDPGASDTHTAVWDWGDNLTSDGNVDQQNDTVTGTYTYTTPGVYEIKITVSDDDSGSGESIYQYVVIYDNSATSGFVTGAGAIDSPSGAYTINPSLSGIARFGFVSKYQPGANTPTGNTQFRFQAAQFSFASTDYQWLVVAGAQAKFKGTGTVNGGGNYGFQLYATDGDINGGRGVDKFRIKIWDKDNNDTVVYDNNLGSGDNTDPTTELTGGNIVIH